MSFPEENEFTFYSPGDPFPWEINHINPETGGNPPQSGMPPASACPIAFDQRQHTPMDNFIDPQMLLASGAEGPTQISEPFGPISLTRAQSERR
ncbi:Fc.00g080620.m01.CDS01 [Cosmosporella sp. VM-42]